MQLKRVPLALAAAALLAVGCGGGEKAGDAPLKVGYVVNYMSHEWYQNICRAAEVRAAELGVDLLIADANLDVAAQISKAENFMAQQVDVLVLTPVDAKALGPIVSQAKAAGIRVITESNPVPVISASSSPAPLVNRMTGICSPSFSRCKPSTIFCIFARENRR